MSGARDEQALGGAIIEGGPLHPPDPLAELARVRDSGPHPGADDALEIKRVGVTMREDPLSHQDPVGAHHDASPGHQVERGTAGVGLPNPHREGDTLGHPQRRIGIEVLASLELGEFMSFSNEAVSRVPLSFSL